VPEALTAQERLRRLERDRRRARRERLVREAAGPVWRAVRGVVPTVYVLAGPLHVHRLIAPRAEVAEALGGAAVLALDAAMRAHTSAGLLSGGDLHVYLEDPNPLLALIEAGLVAPERDPDAVLVRPWPGPPRLFAVITPTLPPHERRAERARVVTRDHLVREVLGAVGLRFDLLAPLVAPLPVPSLPTHPIDP